MPAATYITTSCVISNNVVYKNAKPVYENKEGGLQNLLLSVYRYLAITYPRFYKMDNLSKLGWLAVNVLLHEKEAKNYQPADVGIVLTNASASLDTDIKYFDTIKDIASPALFVYTLPNIVIGEVCIQHGFKGENAFFVAEHFDAGFIEQYVKNLVNNNNLQACICGWVDVMEEEYKAVLFFVEKTSSHQSIIFSKENLNKIYEVENG